MISDSDSGSDSDDCLVYKTVRPVVWSDEEEEKPKVNAGAGSRRAREEVDDLDEVVCATSASARKRARTARAAEFGAGECVGDGDWVESGPPLQ